MKAQSLLTHRGLRRVWVVKADPADSGNDEKAARRRLVFPFVGSFYSLGDLVTLPERMHRVQARTYFELPSTTARTRCRLGSHRRFVTLCAWEILLPVIGPLPQISHRCAISVILLEVPKRKGTLLIAQTPPDGKVAHYRMTAFSVFMYKKPCVNVRYTTLILLEKSNQNRERDFLFYFARILRSQFKSEKKVTFVP